MQDRQRKNEGPSGELAPSVPQIRWLTSWARCLMIAYSFLAGVDMMLGLFYGSPLLMGLSLVALIGALLAEIVVLSR